MPYMVRWTVAGRVATRTFPSAVMADGFRARLIGAIEEGQAFDIATGLPGSMLPAKGAQSWLDFCTDYVASRWPDLAAKTRESMCDSLATVALAMTRINSSQPAPGQLRRAFLWATLPANKDADPPPEVDTALGWLRQNSLPVKAIAEPGVARRVLRRLTLTLTDEPVAGDTWRRRRRGLNTAIEYAVEVGELEENPLKRARTSHRAAADAVESRVVVTHAQARDLLTAVSYVGSWDRSRGRRLVAFFATMYYAGLRPAEAVALCEGDCQLPEHGWGTLTLSRSLPVSTKKWTDGRGRHDPRGLKQRDPDAVRVVPAPPWLVELLKAHLREFGTATDGRLFRNERGGIIGSTTYSRVWEEARQIALSPAQARSPLAGRPYDLRHAALSTWLSVGVPPAEVAKRAGNSVEVLLRRYAGCLDNQAESINRRIENAMDDISPEIEH